MILQSSNLLKFKSPQPLLCRYPPNLNPGTHVYIRYNFLSSSDSWLIQVPSTTVFCGFLTRRTELGDALSIPPNLSPETHVCIRYILSSSNSCLIQVPSINVCSRFFTRITGQGGALSILQKQRPEIYVYIRHVLLASSI